VFTRVLLGVHLVCAFSATAAFWVSATASKGGMLHRAAGRRFSQFMYAAAATGGTLAILGLMVPSLLNPVYASGTATRQKMTLILYLLIVIVAPVQHGLAVIAAGPAPMRVRSRPHAVLCTACLIATVVMLPVSVAWHAWGALLVSPAGFIIGLRNMLYASRPVASETEWQREHLTSLLTAGILFHTAFFALTAARWPAAFGHLPWSAAPWLTPVAVGLPVMLYLRRRRVI
jgi:hypothetical protein